jgi:hypothetical protein
MVRVSHLEPDDRFDLEWPHALGRELDRIPLPPRPAWGRYAVARRKRRSPGGFWIARPAFAGALLAAIVAVTAVLGATGRLPFQAPGTLPRTAHVKQQTQTNEGLPPVAAPTIAPSLAPIVTAPVGNYSYGWSAAPAAPQAWTPGAVNDWDLLATSDFPSDQGGTMQGRFGADCSPPPATHQLRALADSAYLCRGQLMTAIDGGGDAPKTYGGVYLSPAQLADLGQGTTVGWQVSALRSSANDWWDVWLTPFDENLVAPVAPGEAPAFNGAPADAVHIRMNNGTCPGSGQPATLGATNGVAIGTVFDVEVFANHKATAVDGQQPCLESALGRVTADTMGSFRLVVSQHHLQLSVARAGGGAPLVLADANVSLPFTSAVVQFAHHSFQPTQACGGDGTCGPNTYRWSGVTINPSVPFTMLRPNGAASVHGRSATVQLPQPAPAGSRLRFYAFGTTRVSFDGHPAVAATAQQGQQAGTGEASYWTPVPAGTTSIALSGSGASGLPWWVQDVAVWAPPS